MLNNTKKIKVLLYGNVPSRDYRSQVLIKFLSESNYYISLIHPDSYIPKKIKQLYLIAKIFSRFHLVKFFIKAASVDVIYLLPMNTRFIRNAVWVAKIFNKKLVVEMYISGYDTLVKDRKLIKDGSKKAKAVMAKDILALTKSDYIIHTAAHEVSYWEKIIGINVEKEKVFIAPICNISMLNLNRKFRQDGVLKICWWGTFIPLHGLDEILQAMKILKEKKLHFTCNLFGVNNTLFSTYVEKMQLEKLDSHVFLRKDLSFSNVSLPRYLVNNCDLALGIFGNTDKASNVVPNKLIEALSMGIPTLTMNSPALREFFNPETDLWTCEPSPKSIAESVLTIADGAAYPVDWEQTRQKVQDTFSVTHYQEVVSKVLERATNDLLGGETSNVENGVFATHQNATNQLKR